MSEVTYTVKFNKPPTFTDQTGVSFVNVTIGETVNTGIVATGGDGVVNPIAYTFTWLVDPVIGDFVEWRYSGGNYSDASGESVSFDDTMQGAASSPLTSIDHKALIEVDVTGNGWLGSSGWVTVGDGTAVCTGDNLSVNLVADNPIVANSAFRLRINSNAVSNRTDNFIRRKVINLSGDEVRCSVNHIGGGDNQIMFYNRIGGVNQGGALKTLVLSAIDLAAGFIDFTMTDTGSGIVFTCEATGESISITNAELELTAGGPGTGNDAPTIYTGIGAGTDGVGTYIDRFKVFTGSGMEDQTLTLVNCNNQTVNGEYRFGSIYSGTKDILVNDWYYEKQATGVNTLWVKDGTQDVNIGWGDTPDDARLTQVTILAGASELVTVTGNYIAWGGTIAGTVTIEQSVAR